MIIIWKIVSIFALNLTVYSYEKDPYFTRQQSGYPKARTYSTSDIGEQRTFASQRLDSSLRSE